MSTSKTIFVLVFTVLMLAVTIHEVNKFGNGEELQAIFDVVTLTFCVAFWVWVLLIIKM